ncbi:hypothetical protein COF64_07495 [Bacillus sp. AFS043905]|nr:hypothetical protein COF64_07495 [Bacillus sp. AFS043905]
MGTLISTSGTRFPRAGGSLLGVACGVSHATLSPQESRTFRSNQLCVLKEKTAGRFQHEPCLRLVYPLSFSPVILIGWKKIATLLPKYCLAEEAWQTVGGKGADFWNQLEYFLEQTAG